ncbi:MAG: AtpZ/AtpI family protein [Acidobacteria bacterium]|jgi:ATP synthase protein I|nr:AtpZ/AtpI family protein [Acidobacteriota bacterium]
MADRDEENVTAKSGLVYAAVISFVLSTVVLMGLGWGLDRWLGTAPWLVVTGIVLGAGVGFYQFIRLLSRIS